MVQTENPAHIKPHGHRHAGRTWAAYLMLVPSVTLFALFVLYPLAWVGIFAFFEWDGITTGTFTGMRNLTRVVTSDFRWWRAVANTFLFAMIKLPVELGLALCLAVFLDMKLRGRNLLRAIYFLPNVMSPAVISLVFYFIFSPYNGILNGILMEAGLMGYPVNWLGSRYLGLTSAATVSVWHFFGLNMVLMLAALQTIPKELYESAAIDGAGSWQTFRFITLPLMAPILRIVVMLAIIGTLNSFDIIWVLTGGNNGTDVMQTYIVKYFFSSSAGAARAQVGYGAALSLVGALIIGCVTLVYLAFSRRKREVA